MEESKTTFLLILSLSEEASSKVLDVLPTPSVLPQSVSVPFCLISINVLIIRALDAYYSTSTTVFPTVDFPGIFVV